MMRQNYQSSKLFRMIILAILGAVSLVLLFLNFPLPFLPPYLKIDFGEVPALLASLIFSPMAGVIVLAIKDVLYLLIGGGEPVGVTANFLAGILFVFPVALIYHKYKGVKSVVSGLVMGTLIMAVSMSVLNYFVLLPAYAWFMGMEEMKMESVKRVAVIYGILPFNVLRGLIVGLLFIPLFTKMRGWIEKRQAKPV